MVGLIRFVVDVASRKENQQDLAAILPFEYEELSRDTRERPEFNEANDCMTSENLSD